MIELAELSEVLIAEGIIEQPMVVDSKVSGGCINDCYRIHSGLQTYFLKTNSATAFPGMFSTERSGLSLLASAEVIRIPHVIFEQDISDKSYLLMEFLEAAPADDDGWKAFGSGLASLHQVTSPTFGLDDDNYIGSLRQENARHENWASFYLHERMVKQLEVGVQNGWAGRQHYKEAESLARVIENEFPVEPPALLHGDLWSGNFIMINSDQGIRAALVDPAVYYGHREMDLGMSELFGGFHPLFYEAYQAEWPLHADYETRRPIHQLYPLLVHANLFGGNYVAQVRQFLARFRD